jgi:hypothetical protein
LGLVATGYHRRDPRRNDGVEALDDQSLSGAARAPEPNGPPGLKSQLGATVAAARRLIAAHVALGRAELGEILAEVRRVVLAGLVALGCLAMIALLVTIGGLLFIGDWVFGSLGWGILHGSLLFLAIAVAALVGAVGWSGRSIGVALLLALVIGVGVGLLFGLNLSNQAWAALGEQVVGTVPAEIRPLVVGTTVLAIVGGVLGLVLGARAGMGGAIVGLVGGAILGAAIGALSAITFTPEVGAAIGVSVGLLAWPILLGIDVARRGIDTEALAAKFTPRATMDMTKETIEWVRVRTPLGPRF